jgi:hypothetical protein
MFGKLNIQTVCPYSLAEAAGKKAGRAAREDGSCWACGKHDELRKVVVPDLSKHPLMGINAQDPFENPDAQDLQESCWGAFKNEAPLCEGCSENPIFATTMYKDPGFFALATEAGNTAGREGGCVSCNYFNDEKRMEEIILPEIHPTKPLLQIGKYEGATVHEIQKAFIKAYHQSAPQSCSNCHPD